MRTGLQNLRLADITQNPNRDYKVNPINQAEVKKQIGSIQRNEWWENVVVRPHPTSRGKYQLAYGHHRLEALKKLGYKSAKFNVRNLSDWVMYTSMVDENATQKNRTPENVTEDILAGLKLVEQYIKECETVEEFNSVVLRRTTESKVGNYERQFREAKQKLEQGEGLGRRFVQTVLPDSIPAPAIQNTIDTVYQKKQTKAKVELAKAKRHKAAAEQSTAKAKKLLEEAAELEAEARKIAGRTIDFEILLSMPTTKHMIELGNAIKREKIPAKHHQNLANDMLRLEVTANRMSQTVHTWWYRASGKETADRMKARRAKFTQRHEQKTIDEFVDEIIDLFKGYEPRLEELAEYADAIESKKKKQLFKVRTKKMVSILNKLLAKLDVDEDTNNVVPMDVKRLRN